MKLEDQVRNDLQDSIGLRELSNENLRIRDILRHGPTGPGLGPRPQCGPRLVFSTHHLNNFSGLVVFFEYNRRVQHLYSGCILRKSGNFGQYVDWLYVMIIVYV
ncbi:hypothetical protein TNCV_3024861 [Trichonephila clavipes]|nr:hypothetical protein TNCV_3024861 [Trichonephila clavipes]